MDLSNPATCDNSAALTALTQGGFVMMMVFIVFSHKQGNNSPPLHHPRHIHHRSTPCFRGGFQLCIHCCFPTVHPQATGQCGQLTEARIQWQQPSCMNHGTFIHTPASRQRFWTPAPRCKRLSLARLLPKHCECNLVGCSVKSLAKSRGRQAPQMRHTQETHTT